MRSNTCTMCNKHQTTESNNINMLPPAKNNPPRKELVTAARGGGIGVAGMVCSRILALLLQAAIARLFGITFFGYYITGLMLCRILQVVSGMGLHIGSVRYMVQSMAHGNRYAMFLVYRASILTPLFAGSIIGFFLYIAAPGLCNTVFSEPDLLPVLQFFSLAVPWFALFRVLAELSRSFGTVRYTVLVEDIFFPLLQICLLLSALMYKTNGLIAVFAFLIAAVVCATIMGVTVYRQIRHHVFTETNKLEKSPPLTIRELFIYSVPCMPTGIFFMLSNNIDIFMLNILSIGGAVGIYAAATRWTVLLDSIGMPIFAIFRPLIAKAVSTNDTGMLRSLLMASSRWVLYLILPFTAFLFVASQPAMELFLKEKPQETASILLWILLAARISNPLGNGAGLVLTMGGQQYRDLFSLVCGAGLNVILNSLLIPYYGVVGAAVATGISFYLTTILRVSFVQQKWGMITVSKPMIIPAVALCIVILIRLLLHPVMLDAFSLQTAGGGIAAFFVMCCCMFSFAKEPDDKSIARLLPQSVQKIIGLMPPVVHSLIAKLPF